MGRLKETREDLLASDRTDRGRLLAFLGEAGGQELSELGEGFSREPAARRASLLAALGDLASDPDWNVRESVARVLGAMGDRRAAPVLEGLLRRGEEALVRFAALRALWAIEAIDARRVEGLLADADPLIRVEAARALASAGDLEPVYPLLNDPDPAVRDDVAGVLNDTARLNGSGDGAGHEIPLRLTPTRREAALAAIERLEASHGLAGSVARKLLAALGRGRIGEDVLAQHSRWCHSDGGFCDAVGPAREAAVAMYGFVPERLVGKDEGRVRRYHELISAYKKRLSRGGTGVE